MYSISKPVTGFCTVYETRGQNFNSELRRDHRKKLYGRCTYESVNDDSQFMVISRKAMKKILY